MTESIQGLTLRNKLNEAERITRELIHHVEHGFIPKARDLRRTARHGNDPKEQELITDKTIRNTVEKAINSDDFTRTLTKDLTAYLESIEEDVNRILGN